MAETSQSQSRLTVLTGPLAGRELVLEEAVDNILIGSDEACRFHLPTPGVEPIHARLWMDASGVTIYETHSGRGIYVNDDRVTGQAPLRNGDILWLGTPGDDDVVMIQCRLPVRASAAATPAAEAPSIVVPEADQGPEETMVIVSDEPERPSAPAAEAPSEDLFDRVSDEVPAIEPEESTLEAVSDDAPASADFVIEETQAMAAPEAPHSEGFTSDEGFPFPPPPLAPLPAFEDETEADTVMRHGMPEPPMEPTVAMPPAHEPEPEAPPASQAPTLIAPPPPAPTPPPLPPPVHAAPPPTPRPPAAPAARPPRPAPAPREARPAPAPRPKKAGGGGSGLYVVLGLVALAVLGGGGFFAWRFLNKGAPTTAPTPPPPTTMAAAPMTQPAVTAPPETQAAAPPTTTPVEEAVTTVKTPAPPSPSPVASKAPASPTPTTTKATTPATTVPAAPSADALRAQQVATLLGQADAAAAAHNPEQAAGLYDQVLRLEPENAKAGAGKTAAMAIVTSMRKSFVTGKTVVRGGKAAKGGPAGFDSEDVNLAKAPDYSGRIEFEVSPAHVKPGDAYTVHVFLTNDGKKSFKIGSLNVATTTNGTKAGGPVTPAVKEVQPQQRVSLQDAGGTWTEGTTSWNLEVDVVSDHGDSFKNQVTWR